MTLEGGCFCGAVRYKAEGEPVFKGQCHCRSCQHISGGAPNLFMLIPCDGFRYTAGTPKQFRRSDRAAPVTREFCADCGTHITTHRPGLDPIILKVGTLDDPSIFRGAKAALFVAEKQSFHCIPEGIPSFDGLPPM
ncbi:GFA family protein [Ruegeria sp. EL01]|jgi:hypothetical protein|uniref:GFA family protein n=1 Tax=Ruegeria sp. EL01 TaxID=2107578 RepID=UPI000EA7FDFF|nr:GFA family protein [Ruegeria sp. EL01]